MKVIRPIQHGDFSALYEIAEESGIGFTSLPVDESLLRHKIEHSNRGFATQVSEPGCQSYLFVMHDTDSDRVVGTSGIEATVGLDDAFYHYHRGKVVHASHKLDVYNTVDILTLCNDYTGASEICTLFLREEAREGYNGRFLSKFRFLFMQEHRERFAETVIAEMRGVSDEQGNSPFWQWLEEHFFSMDFPTADYLTGIGEKVFIAELMPKYPIYVNLLSKAAQAVIGEVHEQTRPALQLLKQEGFCSRGYVDIFDGGPTVEANLDNIRTAQVSRKLPIKIDCGQAMQGELCFVINTEVQDFRGVATEIIYDKNQVWISQAAADALNIQENDMIRFSPAKFQS